MAIYRNSLVILSLVLLLAFNAYAVMTAYMSQPTGTVTVLCGEPAKQEAKDAVLQTTNQELAYQLGWSTPFPGSGTWSKQYWVTISVAAYNMYPHNGTGKGHLSGVGIVEIWEEDGEDAQGNPIKIYSQTDHVKHSSVPCDTHE